MLYPSPPHTYPRAFCKCFSHCNHVILFVANQGGGIAKFSDVKTFAPETKAAVRIDPKLGDLLGFGAGALTGSDAGVQGGGKEDYAAHFRHYMPHAKVCFAELHLPEFETRLERGREGRGVWGAGFSTCIVFFFFNNAARPLVLLSSFLDCLGVFGPFGPFGFFFF